MEMMLPVYCMVSKLFFLRFGIRHAGLGNTLYSHLNMLACTFIVQQKKTLLLNPHETCIVRQVHRLESHFLHSKSCSVQHVQAGKRSIKSRNRFCTIQRLLPIEVKVFPESISQAAKRVGGRAGFLQPFLKVRVYAKMLRRLVFRVALVAIRTIERPERIRISVIVCGLQL